MIVLWKHEKNTWNPSDANGNGRKIVTSYHINLTRCQSQQSHSTSVMVGMQVLMRSIVPRGKANFFDIKGSEGNVTHYRSLSLIL